MIRKLLFVFFIASLSAQGQTSVYHPFPDSNAVWNVHYMGPWTLYNEFCSYVINGDTAIGSYTWHKLLIPHVHRTGDTSSTQRHTAGYAGCIRQDIPAKKVFYTAPGDTAPVLLYDFNLQVGDTVPGFTRFGFNEPAMVISTVDSVLVGSDYRKAWRFTPFFPFSYNPAYYIEGMGRISGLLEGNQLGLVADGGGFSLSCFQQNGVTLFPDTSLGCNIIISVNDFPEKQFSISIFPNPATNQFTILDLRSTILNVEIYNMIGEKVYSYKPVTGNQKPVTINVSHWNNGIYFVKLKTPNGDQTQKLMVHH